jgi:putative endonuclease
MSGSVSYYRGLSAEEQVAAQYAQAGHNVYARRWRGKSGEIDIIAAKDDILIFIEVKCSKTHRRAAERLSTRQAARIVASAEEYRAGHASIQNMDCRFDVALVDDTGRIAIIDNALVA